MWERPRSETRDFSCRAASAWCEQVGDYGTSPRRSVCQRQVRVQYDELDPGRHGDSANGGPLRVG